VKNLNENVSAGREYASLSSALNPAMVEMTFAAHGIDPASRRYGVHVVLNRARAHIFVRQEATTCLMGTLTLLGRCTVISFINSDRSSHTLYNIRETRDAAQRARTRDASINIWKSPNRQLHPRVRRKRKVVITAWYHHIQVMRKKASATITYPSTAQPPPVSESSPHSTASA